MRHHHDYWSGKRGNFIDNWSHQGTVIPSCINKQHSHESWGDQVVMVINTKCICDISKWQHPTCFCFVCLYLIYHVYYSSIKTWDHWALQHCETFFYQMNITWATGPNQKLSEKNDSIRGLTIIHTEAIQKCLHFLLMRLIHHQSWRCRYIWISYIYISEIYYCTLFSKTPESPF